MNHIKNIFHVQFKLKRRPDGHKYILELNQQEEIIKFIDVVKPYVKNIPCMEYKVNIDSRLNKKKSSLEQRGCNIRIASLKPKDISYSKEDEALILTMRSEGKTYKQIAESLNRSYWGIVDKIIRM